MRAAYGLPHKSQAEIAKDAGISGAISAVGVPVGKALAKVGEVVAPATLKAAIAAKQAFGASREALEATMKRLNDLLGLDAKAAATAAASPIERREARAAYFAGKNLSFKAASDVYQDVGKSYVARMTPNASQGAYLSLRAKYGAKALPLLDNGVDFSRPTWRMIQEFRKNARRLLRHLPEDSGNMASDLQRVVNVATRDMKAIMTPQDVQRLNSIDQHWSDLSSQFPAAQARAIATAPNAPKVMAALIKGEPSQIETMLRGIDRLPMADRVKKLTALKKATGEWIHDQAANGKDYVGQLNAYGKALSDVPDVAFNRLYGPGTKDSMRRAVEATVEFHRKMLAHPDMISAIQAEMRAKPLPWIVRHARWVAFGALYGAAKGDVGAAGAALAIGLTPDVMHVLLNNPMAQKLYLRAVTAQSPKAIADGFRALLTALASEQIRGPIKEEAAPAA